MILEYNDIYKFKYKWHMYYLSYNIGFWLAGRYAVKPLMHRSKSV